MDRSGALSQFFMKKNTRIFFYTCFYVKMTKNNQTFNMLKTTKNYKSQINQKFNLLKNAKNQKSQKNKNKNQHHKELLKTTKNHKKSLK